MNNCPSEIQKGTDGVYSFSLGENTVIWFVRSNKYLVAQPIVTTAVEMLINGVEYKTVVNFCFENLKIEKRSSEKIVEEIGSLLDGKIVNKKSEPIKNKVAESITSSNLFSKKYYKINQTVFQADFELEEAQNLCHPKFAHLGIPAVSQADHHFIVSYSDGLFSLIVNNEIVGTWNNHEGHFLGGKFSMQILQKIYKREEKDWLGVFHAAGISDGNSGIMFLGASGSGKSTLSALLLANGYDILSDDFLPVESSCSLMCRFPAAISIKNQAYDIVKTNFPELNDLKEYISPDRYKTYRYLPVPNTNLLKVPCKAFVLVNYDKNSALDVNKISSIEVFQHLVPESWLSPIPENVFRFFDWFKKIPCYRLTYSDNRKMLLKVKQLFNDELL